MTLAMKQDILRLRFYVPTNVCKKCLTAVRKRQTHPVRRSLQSFCLITLFVNQHRVVSFKLPFVIQMFEVFSSFFSFLCLQESVLIIYVQSSVIDIQISSEGMIRQLKRIHENIFCFSPSREKMQTPKACWIDVIWSLIFDKHVF